MHYPIVCRICDTQFFLRMMRACANGFSFFLICLVGVLETLGATLHSNVQRELTRVKVFLGLSEYKRIAMNINVFQTRVSIFTGDWTTPWESTVSESKIPSTWQQQEAPFAYGGPDSSKSTLTLLFSRVLVPCNSL